MEVSREGNVLRFDGGRIRTQVFLDTGIYHQDVPLSYAKNPCHDGKRDKTRQITAHCTDISGTTFREAVFALRNAPRAMYDTIAFISDASGTYMESCGREHAIRISRTTSDDIIMALYPLDVMIALAHIMNSDCTAQIWFREDYPMKIEWRNRKFPLTFSLLVAPRMMND